MHAECRRGAPHRQLWPTLQALELGRLSDRDSSPELPVKELGRSVDRLQGRDDRGKLGDLARGDLY
jgi:hypothetical protein